MQTVISHPVVIYFDHNATAPLLPAAQDAWIEACHKWIGNPSSPHRLGARADKALGDSREELAAIIGCTALEIVWTSGATESSNAIFHHLAQTLPEEALVWLSAVEHPAVIAPAHQLFPGRCRFIGVTSEGLFDVEEFSASLAREPRPGVLAVMAANNETGVVQPWRELQQLCSEHAILFVCDAAQWLGKLPGTGLGKCDFVSGCAHKFGGPRGIGFLKTPSRGRSAPLIGGGPQEEGRRAGTENVAGVSAMLVALRAREHSLRLGLERGLQEMRANFERQLVGLLPDAVIVGRRTPRLWNTVSVIMPRLPEGQRWVVKLDRAGFAVSTGSACSSGRERPSHVLEAMGISSHHASRAIRFSSGWETSEQDWSRLLAAVQQVAAA